LLAQTFLTSAGPAMTRSPAS